ncbi:DUF6538 domain-containing protein [Aliarcobacter butzleri]|uniref:DUF6538 domain-containing protein n=1 Tax=Aliarcobacter butzleri TaxID=28197 RepID=UPI001EDB3032|nr:DUF6538 domain-containing protein [Aliarcobacter butzleri]MCG3671912.1 hypothetical protein [Aliarcobacter butzleri]
MNYLQRRNGVYYFKKRVDSKLSKTRNQVIRKSLQTKCYNTAKKLASLLNYWANVYFESGIIMTIEKMDEILYNYFQNSMEENSVYEDLRHEKNTIEKDGEVYEGSTKKALLHQLKKHNKLDKKRELAEVKRYVEDEIIPTSMIEKNELQELREMKEFYWKIFKYYGEILQTDLSRFEGYSVEDSINKHKKEKVKHIYLNSENEDEDIEEDVFEVMVNKYLSHIKIKKKLLEITLNDYRPSYNLVNEVFPNKKLSKLTTKDLEYLEDIISNMPTNRKKIKIIRDLNIYQQVEFMKNILEDRKNKIFRKEYEKINIISDKTQNKHFEQITGFIDFCSKKYGFKTPLNGIVLQRYRIKSDSSTERLLLSDDELKTIFKEFDYLNEKLLFTLKKDPLKIYGIFLMMFLGMRPIEAGQLMVNDLKETKDSQGNTIYYLKVSKENSSGDEELDGIKKEKTDNAKRKLPLTDIFIKDLQFLEFVNKRKKEKQKFIFVDILKDKDIKQTIDNTVRRCEYTFNSKIKKMNFKNLDRKSFYSLRHSFANKLNHIPEALQDKRGESLMGHTGATDSELFNRYGNSYFEPDFLYEILVEVKYDDFDFSKIKREIEKNTLGYSK